MTAEELEKVLEDHLHWINEDCEGWETMHADLSDANLWGADLGGANLSDADLRGADLDYSFPRLDTIVRICSELGMNEVTIRWK